MLYYRGITGTKGVYSNCNNEESFTVLYKPCNSRGLRVSSYRSLSKSDVQTAQMEHEHSQAHIYTFNTIHYSNV